MDELLDALPRHDRNLVDRLATDAGVPAAALLPEIISAYLRLLKEVPAALPRDPLRSLSVAAARRTEPQK
jgi:hypothetical protein